MYSIKHTFFCTTIEQGFLSEEESNHAVRVLRLKANDFITIIDGKGKSVKAQITVSDKKRLHFNIEETLFEESPKTKVHIAIAPTKNMDRFQFFIEKATEIGIDEITPILTKNSERKVINIEKVRKSCISALKQSGNLYLPKINDLQKIEDFTSTQDAKHQIFIAHCETDQDKTELKDLLDDSNFVTILIGPEGDFSSEEIKLAKKNGWIPTSLGSTRLRTETAGIVACHTVRLIS